MKEPVGVIYGVLINMSNVKDLPDILHFQLFIYEYYMDSQLFTDKCNYITPSDTTLNDRFLIKEVM